MLEKLFTSKTRSKIITIFLLHPQKEMYIREITKKLQVNINAVRRELINLEEIGLLKSRETGNLKYYAVNTKFYLYPELYGMVLKTEGPSKLINEKIENWGTITLALIFGSFASRKPQPESDIDLLIVGEINENKLIPEINEIERELSREINYILLSNKEYKQKIKNNDPLLKEILDNPKIIIKGGNSC
jgi:predicted nucleotidyltransferase